MVPSSLSSYRLTADTRKRRGEIPVGGRAAGERRGECELLLTRNGTAFREEITVITTPQILGAEQIDRFKADGYLVVPDLLTDAEVDAFVQHLAEEKATGTYGLQGHRQDPQYRYLA